MKKRLTKIKGQHVAFTGFLWCNRLEFQRKLKRAGAIPTPKGRVNRNTTVLVKGTSGVWKFGDHGLKEDSAAKHIRAGQQIAVVQGSEFQKLLEHRRPARLLEKVAGQPIEWLVAPPRKAFQRTAAIKGALDREHSAMGRVEQSYLGGKLFGNAEEATCCLCGRRFPLSLMIAGHIKPRSECSRRERLDAENIVFGVCLLGCDALYERGLVSVGPKGKIYVSSPAYTTRSLATFLRQLKRRRCAARRESNAAYFDWHLTHQFLG
jgi:hypothetical protein